MPLTTVLLGAGASVDAGLPISTGLTRQIAEAINPGPDHGYSGVSHALNRTIGSIIAHQTAAGTSPYAGVDAETVFSAVKMLSERDSLEIAPFVETWNDTPSGHKVLPPRWSTHFSNSLLDKRTANVDFLFRKGVEALTASDPKIYVQVMDAMLEGLHTILKPASEDCFDYLSPLFTSPGPISIATLNYDQGVELAAAQTGHDLDRGIETWEGGFDWRWAGRGAARLLKLHGSLDWTLKMAQRDTDDSPFAKAAPVIHVEDEEATWHESRPAVIFGAREKLQAEGPFLAMLFEFSRWMRNTEHLIVVGYSFRDTHINVILRDWLQSDGAMQLTIVDPAFPVETDYSSDDFTDFLLRGIYYEGFEPVRGTGEFQPRTHVRPRFTILREGAATGLLKACSPTLDLF
jgi:SIR2-like domain